MDRGEKEEKEKERVRRRKREGRESWIGERELLDTGKFPSQEREGQRGKTRRENSPRQNNFRREREGEREESDGYYVAYKSITLLCILFMFIEMKFIHCHSCVMFAMKSMSMCND